jgi:hypothetical protein
MSVQRSPSATDAAETGARPVSPAALIAAAVVLIAFIAFLAYRTLGPFTPPETFSVQDQKTWVNEAAKKSQGDFSRLSPEEQKKLNDISLGNGATYLRRTYERQQGGNNPRR